MNTPEAGSFLFWNVGGLGHLWDLDMKKAETIGKHQIIGLVETWNCKDLKLPSYLSHYTVLEQEATREGSRGRPSAGLLLLIEESRNLKIISHTKSRTSIKTRVLFNNTHIVIALTYIKPGVDSDADILDLFEEIDEITQPEDPLFILGDFNARIGNLGAMPETGSSSSLIVTRNRNASDAVVNNRGRSLCSITEERNLIILNGRVQGDEEGEYSFINHKGISTIDLAIVNEEATHLIKHMSFITMHTRGHIPLTIQVGETRQCTSIAKQDKPLWREEKKVEWREEVERMLTDSPVVNASDFISIIKTAAKNSGLWITQGSLSGRENKPYNK